MQGYVVNFLRTNYWRVQASMEFQDCMQEAHWLFLKLADRYGVLDSPQHFMGLYKQAWYRHFTDLSNIDTAVRSYILDSQLSDDPDDESYHGVINSMVGDTDTCGSLLIMLQQAPDDIRAVLSFFLLAPQDLIESAFESWRQSKRKKSGGNKMLCKLLGLDPGTDILGKVFHYFGTA